MKNLLSRKIYLIKNVFLLGIVCLLLQACKQNGITFRVEKLPDPEIELPAVKNITDWLILSSEVDRVPYEIEKSGITYPYGVVASSKLPDSLVVMECRPFFKGMYWAYAYHHPFVLSPDMMWLLICQGFARHVNANPETMRNFFVNFEGKKTLTVTSTQIDLNNPRSGWEKVFPLFTRQISGYTGTEFIKLLSADFSTTTPVEKIASEITIMETTKPYFEFVIMRIICGIPKITLKGTPEDWQLVLDKTKQLARYDLEWWTKELVPLLEEFVRASKGKIDTDFWRNMFKYHTLKQYGAPNVIDGWIVKFFPYDKDGKRNNLQTLIGGDNLPDEIVKVDVDYYDLTGENPDEKVPLEIWAGFFGLEQRRGDLAFTPKIGWMVRKKNTRLNELRQVLLKSTDDISNMHKKGIISYPENQNKKQTNP